MSSLKTTGRAGDALVIVGSGAVIGFSWQPLVTMGLESPYASWTIWGGQVSFLTPIAVWAAAGALVLALIRLVGGERTVAGWRLSLLAFAFGLISLTLLAGYALSDKHVFFDREGHSLMGGGPLPEPRMAFGGAVMLCGAIVAVAGAVVAAFIARPVSTAARAVGRPYGDVVVVLGAALTFFGSAGEFVAWAETLIGPHETATAWSWNTFMAPLSWTIAIGVASAALFAVWRRWRGERQAPGVSWAQWSVITSAVSVVVTAGYLTSARMVIFWMPPDYGDDFTAELADEMALHVGSGLQQMFAGALVTFCGAVLSYALSSQQLQD